MATKTITITNNAYERLSVFKEPNESFSEVITKLTMKYSILDLVGILSSKEAEELEINIKKTRARLRKNIEKTFSKIK